MSQICDKRMPDGSSTDGSGDGAWLNQINLEDLNEESADVTLDKRDESDWLVTFLYGHDIPEGAVIERITVYFRMRATNPGKGFLEGLRLTTGGYAISGNPVDELPIVNTTYSTHMNLVGLSVADVNDDNFGIKIRVDSMQDGEKIHVAWVQLEVCIQDPATHPTTPPPTTAPPE